MYESSQKHELINNQKKDTINQNETRKHLNKQLPGTGGGGGGRTRSGNGERSPAPLGGGRISPRCGMLGISINPRIKRDSDARVESRGGVGGGCYSPPPAVMWPLILILHGHFVNVTRSSAPPVM